MTIKKNLEELEKFSSSTRVELLENEIKNYAMDYSNWVIENLLNNPDFESENLWENLKEDREL